MDTPAAVFVHSEGMVLATLSEPYVAPPWVSVQLARTTPPEVEVSVMVPVGGVLPVQGMAPIPGPQIQVAPAPDPPKDPQSLVLVQVVFTLLKV